MRFTGKLHCTLNLHAYGVIDFVSPTVCQEGEETDLEFTYSTMTCVEVIELQSIPLCKGNTVDGTCNSKFWPGGYTLGMLHVKVLLKCVCTCIHSRIHFNIYNLGQLHLS